MTLHMYLWLIATYRPHQESQALKSSNNKCDLLLHVLIIAVHRFNGSCSRLELRAGFIKANQVLKQIHCCQVCHAKVRNMLQPILRHLSMCVYYYNSDDTSTEPIVFIKNDLFVSCIQKWFVTINLTDWFGLHAADTLVLVAPRIRSWYNCSEQQHYESTYKPVFGWRCVREYAIREAARLCVQRQPSDVRKREHKE